MFWIKFSQSGPGDFGDGMVWILKSLSFYVKFCVMSNGFERFSNAFWTLSNGYAFFTQLDLNSNFQSERFFLRNFTLFFQSVFFHFFSFSWFSLFFVFSWFLFSFLKTLKNLKVPVNFPFWVKKSQIATIQTMTKVTKPIFGNPWVLPGQHAPLTIQKNEVYNFRVPCSCLPVPQNHLIEYM